MSGDSLTFIEVVGREEGREILPGEVIPRCVSCGIRCRKVYDTAL